MDTTIPGLERKPFCTAGKPAVYIDTPPMREALAMMHGVYRDPQGLGILTGLKGSGRQTVLRRFAADLLEEDVAAVVLDGAGMDRIAMLQAILRDIGYALDAVAADDMSSMLRVFLIHQCLAGQPSFLAVLNASEMHPSALEELCRLATIKAGDELAVRIVLACDEKIDRIIEAPAMGAVRERVTARCALRSLDLIETDDYIVNHLRAAGARSHRELLSDEAIALIWRASGGLPGEIESLTTSALESLELPVGLESAREFLGLEPHFALGEDLGVELEPEEEPPTRLIVSLAGDVVSDHCWQNGRLLIGRDPNNDIGLPSRYVSRRHAMLILEADRAWLIDLKSMNGTYRNSQRITQTPLQDGDVISIGNYRLKYVNPAASDLPSELEGRNLIETVVMRSLDEAPHLAVVGEMGPEDYRVRGRRPTHAGAALSD